MRVNFRAATKLILAAVLVCAAALISFAPIGRAQTSSSSPKRIVIAAHTILDGRGHVLHDTRIVVEGSKIVAIDAEGRAGGLRPGHVDGAAGMD